MKVNNLVIEKNVTIPPATCGKDGVVGTSKYRKLLESMDVGDSVLLDFKTYGPKERKAFRSGLWKHCKELNMKVTTRTVDEGFRFWRTK